ncbi:hypothetical protein DBV15_08902 [Temnothorax longispinosus]|uniref:Uncharacterized protein n=1 Tax=Temnothorax longispinosus TaxID=300112 RepID=A0A4V3S6Z5_9HYME|nr:hypothetical protein DBV15_08902 [Temnothorax longispinosus]
MRLDDEPFDFYPRFARRLYSPGHWGNGRTSGHFFQMISSLRPSPISFTVRCRKDKCLRRHEKSSAEARRDRGRKQQEILRAQCDASALFFTMGDDDRISGRSRFPFYVKCVQFVDNTNLLANIFRSRQIRFQLGSWERKGRNFCPRVIEEFSETIDAASQRLHLHKMAKAVLVGQSMLPTSCLSERTMLQ